MARIDTNIILDGITLTLHKSFPDGHVHGEAVTQGLEPKDFIVKLVASQQKQLMGSHTRRVPVFDVLYFPKAEKIECYGVADALCDALELVTLPGGDKLHGTNMSFEIIDDVLHFHVSYGHIFRRDDVQTKMEALELQQGG